MKKYNFLFVLILAVTSVNSQILTNSIAANAIYQSNAFIDASTSYSSSAGENNNFHKGLVYPDVNLTTFQFENIVADGATIPSYYDGMVVYNTATGNTLTTGTRPSTATAVTPGFYYFSNPNGAANGSVTGGVWIPVGANASAKNVGSTEVVLNTKINGAQLYAINGTFTATGTSTIVSVPVPSGMTGYYSFVTYTGGKAFRRDINSFSTASSTNNVITGSGSFSEVLPAGTYSYVLEYFK